MEIKAIIFDYGGTLDTGGRHWSEVLWEAYQKEEIPVSKEDFREAYVYAELEMEAEPLISPTDTFLQVLRTKADLQTKHLMDNGRWQVDELTRRPDAEHIALDCYSIAKHHTAKSSTILKQLSSRYDLAIVSNFYGNLNAVLDDFGLNCFQLVVESAKVGIRKPDSRLLQHTIHELGLQPNEILVVGDSIKNDILPAKSLGCNTVWFKGTGWNGKRETCDVTDHTITNITELLIHTKPRI